MQKKLKIVFVLPVGGVAPSGGFRIIAGYADRLQARGHDVTVIVPEGERRISGPPHKRLRAWVEGLFRRPETGEVPFITNDGVKLVSVRGKNRIDRDDYPDADIYIASWWETVEWLDDIPKHAAKVHFVQGYEVFPFLPIDRVKAVYASPIEKVAVSIWLQTKLAAEFGVSSSLVENVIDADELTQPNRKKNQAPTIGFLYSMTATKNSAMAIEACRKLRKRFLSLHVVAFGSNQPKKSEKAPGWIEFTLSPQAQDIAAIYGSCDVWLFSSDEEGFGLPILEAMAAGTPVVATPAGAAPQLVNDANGALVGHDASELADAAARILLLQPAEWKKMSQAAEQTARRRGWDDATNEFEAALYAVVNRHRGELIKN